LPLVGGPAAYSFPTDPLGTTVRLPFVDAVRMPIYPAVVAERVLAAWSRGDALPEWVSDADPRHERRRGAAVVLSGDRILLIRYSPAVRDAYFIPGGSVEPGETPAAAAIRELTEETGLVGIVDRLLATVLNRSREEHYHLVSTPAASRRRSTSPRDRRSSGCRSPTCRTCRSGRNGWPGGCRGGSSTAGPTHRRSWPTRSGT
jgi:8-oxo-dGTP pyrophosphatase MutT (NUDIX family)